MTDTAVTSVEVERWKPFAGSLLLHFLLIGVALAGWRWWERAAPRAPVQLPIEGRVVYEMPAPRREPRAAPSPPMPEPAEVERRAEAARAALLAEEGVRRERAQRAQEIQADRERQERERAARIAMEQAERDRQERERAAQLERERDLRERLAAEERAAALRAGPEALAWASVIAAHIQRQWFRPPSAQPGLRCVIIVDQIPGGVVTSARIADCNGDAVVRQSIEAAVMRASPLPPPPDPALFERRLEIVFAPVD